MAKQQECLNPSNTSIAWSAASSVCFSTFSGSLRFFKSILTFLQLPSTVSPLLIVGS